MIRNLKIVMTLVAALAMSAVGASAAQAAESQLDVGAAPATLTGSQVVANKLTITDEKGGILTVAKCPTANLEATTVEANVKEATVTATYGNTELKTCEVGGLASAIHMNGCTYTLTNTPVALTWNVDIVCPAGKVIEITQGTCVITIAAQGPLANVTFANVNPGVKHVTATLNVKNIVVNGGKGCPVNLQGPHAADLTGTQTIKAFKDELKEGVPAEGAQVNLEAT